MAAAVLALAAVFAGPGVGAALANPNDFTISNDPVVCENDSGTAFAVFNVNRANPSGAASVDAGTQAVTATADTDYTVTNTNLSFTGTQTDVSFNVPIIGDITDGGNDTAATETFNVQLAGATGTGATAEADPASTGTIVDDDPDPTVSIDDASANEGSFAVFPLHLSFAQASPCTATVLFSTSGGNDATTYSNFPVTFPSGITTTSSPGVSHFCDSFNEGTEIYSASVAGDTNADGTDSSTGTIFDGCVSSTGNADLYIQKVESADPVQVGTEFTYTIGVYNFGPAVAQNVLVSDPLPGGVQFVSAAASQGTCSGTTVVTCSMLGINPGAIHFIAIRVRPTVEAVNQNTATVTSSNFDPFTANNSATTLTQSFVGTVAPPAIPNPGGGVIAALRGSRVCDWSEGRCAVIVDCINLEQDCTAIGRGRVLTSGRVVAGARAFRFRRVKRTVAAGEEEELSFRVGFDARRAIRRALRRGRRVRAKVTVTVTDAAGNRTVRRRNLRITR